MTKPSLQPPGVIRDCVERLLPGSAQWRRVQGGYTQAERWLVDYDGERRAFIKAAVDPPTTDWLRQEGRLYQAVQESWTAKKLAFHDDDGCVVLVIEDLSHADWTPSWSRERVRAVLDTLRAIHRTPVPEWVPLLVDEDLGVSEAGFRDRWQQVSDSPQGFMELGLCSASWFATHIESLVAAASRAVLAGGDLLHLDVRSDNMCFVPKTDGTERVVLVDWNWVAQGNGQVDVAFWLPTLAMEGGPLPHEILPDEPELAALVSGFFAWEGSQPREGDMIRIRDLQRAQLAVAFPWAIRALGLPPPL